VLEQAASASGGAMKRSEGKERNGGLVERREWRESAHVRPGRFARTLGGGGGGASVVGMMREAGWTIDK
jgi:hypothetical protein